MHRTSGASSVLADDDDDDVPTPKGNGGEGGDVDDCTSFPIRFAAAIAVTIDSLIDISSRLDVASSTTSPLLPGAVFSSEEEEDRGGDGDGDGDGAAGGSVTDDAVDLVVVDSPSLVTVDVEFELRFVVALTSLPLPLSPP